MKARRLMTQVLHWITGIFLVFLMSVDEHVFGAIGLIFVVSGGGLCALGLLFGLMNKDPGPALEGVFRYAHPWLSRAMYVLLGWTVAALLAGMLDRALPGPNARTLVLILAAAATAHAIFHLWRHTALRDGALRRIVPRVFHKHL